MGCADGRRDRARRITTRPARTAHDPILLAVAHGDLALPRGDTQDVVEAWRRDLIQEGVKKVLFDIYEMRFGAIPEELRAVIEDMHDEPTLRMWAKLVSSCSVDEVAATIRRSRPS